MDKRANRFLQAASGNGVCFSTWRTEQWMLTPPSAQLPIHSFHPLIIISIRYRYLALLSIPPFTHRHLIMVRSKQSKEQSFKAATATSTGKRKGSIQSSLIVGEGHWLKAPNPNPTRRNLQWRRAAAGTETASRYNNSQWYPCMNGKSDKLVWGRDYGWNDVYKNVKEAVNKVCSRKVPGILGKGYY